MVGVPVPVLLLLSVHVLMGSKLLAGWLVLYGMPNVYSWLSTHTHARSVVQIKVVWLYCHNIMLNFF